MNVDDLTGRALDAAVAERLFGLLVEERADARTGEKDFLYVVRPEAPIRAWVRVAFYSGNMGASLEVEFELLNRGWRRTEPRVSAPGDVRVVLEHSDGRTVEASGPMNVALCRGRLRRWGNLDCGRCTSHLKRDP